MSSWDSTSDRRNTRSLARTLVRIGVAITVGVAILLAVLIAQGLSVHATLETEERQSQIVGMLGGAEAVLVEYDATLRGFVITGDREALARMTTLSGELDRRLTLLRELFEREGDGSRDAVERVRAAVDAYVDDWGGRVIAARQIGPGEAARLVGTGEGERRGDAIAVDVHGLVEAQSMLESDADARLATTLTATFVVLGIVLVAALGGALVAIRALRRCIVGPVVQISGVADAIAAGDDDARVGPVGRAEVARLAFALDAMADRVVANKRALSERNRELYSQREAAERDRALTAAVLAATPAAICVFNHAADLVTSNDALASVPADVLRGLPGEVHGIDEFEDVDGGRWFRRFVAPVLLPDDSGPGTIVVIDDITRERAAERVKSDLVATVSHELRTPLAAVLGYSEVLAHRDLDPAQRREYAETINREAARLSRLVSDLLDLQRIERAGLEPVLDEVDLACVLRTQVGLFAAQSVFHALTLVGADHPVMVWAARDRLEQVISNLLNNAIRYSRGGGTVTVTVAIDEGRANVSVADNGIGIARKDLAHIFDRFYRVDSADVAAVRGSGLGLNVAQEILAAHGSTLTVESELDVGSTFSFSLALVLADVPAA